MHTALLLADAKDPTAHAVGVVEPSAHLDPAEQLSQSGIPASGWYFPAAQREQTALSAGAKLPGEHASGSAAPVSQLDPSGQSEQSAGPCRSVPLP